MLPATRARTVLLAVLLAAAGTGACSAEGPPDGAQRETSQAQVHGSLTLTSESGDVFGVEDVDAAREPHEREVRVDGGLPQGFPADEVPILDLPIEVAMGRSDASGEAYLVTASSSGDVPSTTDAAVALLVDAGFARLDVPGHEGDGQGAVTRRLTGDAWVVTVDVAATDGATRVSYVVERGQD